MDTQQPDDDYQHILNSLSLLDKSHNNELVYSIDDTIKYIKLYDYLSQPLISKDVHYLRYYFDGNGIDLIKRILGPLPHTINFEDTRELDLTRNLALGIKLIGALCHCINYTDNQEYCDKLKNLILDKFENWWLFCIKSNQAILKDAGLHAIYNAIEYNTILKFVLRWSAFSTCFACAVFDESSFVSIQAVKLYSKIVHLIDLDQPNKKYLKLIKVLNVEVNQFQKAILEEDDLSFINNIKCKLDLIWYLCKPEITLKNNNKIKIFISNIISELGLLKDLWFIWESNEAWLKSQASDTIKQIIIFLDDLKCIYNISISNNNIININNIGYEGAFYLINQCAEYLLQSMEITNQNDGTMLLNQLFDDKDNSNLPYHKLLDRFGIVQFLNAQVFILKNKDLYELKDKMDLFYAYYDIYMTILYFMSCPNEFNLDFIIRNQSRWKDSKWEQVLNLRQGFWNATILENFGSSKRQNVIYHSLCGLNSLLSLITVDDAELNTSSLIQLIEYHLINNNYNDRLTRFKTPQYLIAGLELLPNGLLFNDNNNSFDIFHKIVLYLFNNPNLNIPTLNSIYTSIRLTIATKPDLYVDKQEAKQELIHRIEIKLINELWEVRDSTINFIGSLFNNEINNPNFKPTFQFVIENNFINYIFDKLNDNEPYVISSCFKVLANLVRNPMIDVQFIVEVENHLINNGNLNFNYELDVNSNYQRRWHLSLLIELIHFYNRNINILIIPINFPFYLNVDLIFRLAYDEDIDIIMLICKFILACWKLAIINDTNTTFPSSKKVKLQNDNNIDVIQKNNNLFGTRQFYDLNLHTLLVDKLKDASRIVREVVYFILKDIYEEASHYHTINLEEYKYYEPFHLILKPLDWNQLYKLSNADSLYNQAFELSHLKLNTPISKDNIHIVEDVNPNILRNSTFKNNSLNNQLQNLEGQDYHGWFTSDSENEEQDAESYNVLDCY